LLRSLEALDAAGRITPHGRRMVQLPMHPRLAHMVLQAGRGAVDTACLLAALLAERVVAEGPGGERSSSLDDLLDAARRGRHDRARALAHDWLRVVAGMGRSGPTETTDAHGATLNDAGPLLALAFPDRVARRRGPRGERRYLLSGGRGGTLRLEDPLSAQEWLVVAELDDADADAAIRLAAPLHPDDMEELFAAHLTRRPVLAWDSRTRKVMASEVEQLGAITVRERPSTAADPEAILRCLCDGIRSEGLERLDWTPSARQLQGRVDLLRRMFPEQEWPDVSDAALAATLLDWLGPRLYGKRSLDDATRVDLCGALLSWLGPQRERELDRLAPTHVGVPSGSHVRLDYSTGDVPVLAVRIQEVFGMPASPRVAGGRVPVLMHLLSPARRPVQITADLASFWRTGYLEVRKDLRGRYPRHYWPEDPSQAEPTRHLRPR
jgi:ATP-dependent helicase HrpB